MTVTKSRLAREIRDVVDSAPGHFGVSIRLAGRGGIVDIDSQMRYPLASVYKVPLLATLFHKIDLGEISLDKRIVLREIDKSLGSSDLQYFNSGANLTAHDLCYLMIVHSDNTATDMIHYLIGMDAPNAYMHELGLDSIDIYCPNREYFLIFLGWARRFKGKSLGEIAKIWKKMPRDVRAKLFKEIRKETRTRTARDARKLGTELWGIADEKETKEMRDASAVMDNFGSPADIARLLEMIVSDKVAASGLTEQMIEYMLLCDSREGIPSKIPEGIRVANKTGGVPGTVNDSAIIFATPKNTVICACLSTGVKHSERKEARAAIAEIGLAAYQAFRK